MMKKTKERSPKRKKPLWIVSYITIERHFDSYGSEQGNRQLANVMLIFEHPAVYFGKIVREAAIAEGTMATTRVGLAAVQSAILVPDSDRDAVMGFFGVVER